VWGMQTGKCEGHVREANLKALKLRVPGGQKTKTMIKGGGGKEKHPGSLVFLRGKGEALGAGLVTEGEEKPQALERKSDRGLSQKGKGGKALQKPLSVRFTKKKKKQIPKRSKKSKKVGEGH